MAKTHVDHVLQKERLEVDDARILLDARGEDVFKIVAKANQACKSIHGEKITYVVNRNINFTNVCTFKCHFCGFSVPMDAPEAYILSAGEVAGKTREARAREPTLSEICIQGGLHPGITIETIEGYIRAIKSVDDTIHVHGFSPQEIHNLSKMEHCTAGEVIARLKEAGLNSVPGTAAEILVDSVRKKICPSKIPAARWIEVVEAAHAAGLPTTSTMMYGHVETTADMAEHFKLLRDVQERTGGFTEFVPLPFLRNGNVSLPGARPVDGLMDVKVHAVGRLFFKGLIDNIQCSWVKLGVKFCQVLLHAGVNDFSGTLMEENISRCAGSTEGEYIDSAIMKQHISAAGKTPVQRTTTYEIVE